VWVAGKRWQPGEILEPPTLYNSLRRHGLKVADEKTRRGRVWVERR